MNLSGDPDDPETMFKFMDQINQMKKTNNLF